jgi:PAS domain S-box-containing protein
LTAVATRDAGWAALFRDAFRRSLNPMVLTDDHRIQVDANPAFVRLLMRPRKELIGRPIYDFVDHGPVVTEAEWRAALSREEFSGEAQLLRKDGEKVAVQFAGYPEIVTGRRLVLFVAMSVSRWGRHFRRDVEPDATGGDLTERELEVTRLIALGASGPEIAGELNITHHTVRTHVRNAMERLGARSRAHLVAKVLGDGIVFTPGSPLSNEAQRGSQT